MSSSLQIDWREYFENYWVVLRNHTLKYKPESVEESKEHLRRITLYHNVAKGILLVFGLVLALMVVEAVFGLPCLTTTTMFFEYENRHDK